jgi:hypothetical protein
MKWPAGRGVKVGCTECNYSAIIIIITISSRALMMATTAEGGKHRVFPLRTWMQSEEEKK